ncbi:hypothetical protein S7711_10803 [Stachybotrys chartarum IBT 7711]|uniref:Rhodopsin domain-containing protein n=1 Tax=Stachybotrys chartarum (strain CBS 109288 / IBT 7711) TaxID=1280523 RepID=A0A084AR47_STACB|nr:hypothetical protein S7711_10803 [Stachybotrys chartarum IBT 7711]
MNNSVDIPPDHNRGPEILTICGIVFGLALVVVVLWIWVRIRIVGKMGWDDYSMIAASIGFFLLWMTQSPRFRYSIMGVMVFTILSSTGNLLTVFFQCGPLAFIWDPTVPGSECIPTANLRFAAFFNSSVSELNDLVFALLHIPLM